MGSIIDALTLLEERRAVNGHVFDVLDRRRDLLVCRRCLLEVSERALVVAGDRGEMRALLGRCEGDRVDAVRNAIEQSIAPTASSVPNVGDYVFDSHGRRIGAVAAVERAVNINGTHPFRAVVIIDGR